jgi:tRNA A37 threonylcarbamoyladenosine biosynthesis protein TsaE
VCVVEWAEKALSILPTEHLMIKIRYLSDTERSFELKPVGQRYEDMIKILEIIYAQSEIP